MPPNQKTRNQNPNLNPKSNNIFVFGSNLAGIHGAGAAYTARVKHGAIWGRGIGLQGNSYAIPTKDERLKPLPLPKIHSYVVDFKAFAGENLGLKFEVTPIGCGFEGYTQKQIAPFFAGCTPNVVLPKSFVQELGE